MVAEVQLLMLQTKLRLRLRLVEGRKRAIRAKRR